MVKKIETTSKAKFAGNTKIIDPESGEFRDVRIFATSNEVRDKDFTKIFNAFSAALVMDNDIAGKAIRLLFWIINNLRYNEITFYFDRTSTAKELDVTVRTLDAWKKQLIDKNIIKKVSANLYMINPACIMVGSAHTMVNEWEKAGED